MFSLNGTVTVLNSTISQNTAAQGGRGLALLCDGASAVITNTILAQGDTNVSDLMVNQVAGGSATVGGMSSMIGGLAMFPGTGNTMTGLLVADPRLGPLQNNGGPTPTMTPASSSPAFDAGSNAAVPAGVTTDQRGQSRVVGNSVDIGAVEIRRTAVVSIVRTAAQLTNADSVTFTVTFADPILHLAAGNFDLVGTSGVSDANIGTPTTADGGLTWSAPSPSTPTSTAR